MSVNGLNTGPISTGLVDLEKKIAVLSSGDTVEYEHLVNTIPLNRFLTLVEIDLPLDPNAPLRHVELDTIRFYDADGQDITDQIPWNGIRPWDGSSSVTQK